MQRLHVMQMELFLSTRHFWVNICSNYSVSKVVKTCVSQGAVIFWMLCNINTLNIKVRRYKHYTQFTDDTTF